MKEKKKGMENSLHRKSKRKVVPETRENQKLVGERERERNREMQRQERDRGKLQKQEIQEVCFRHCR